MIPLTDVSFTLAIKQLLDPDTVVWSSNEQGRKAIAKVAKQKEANYPGIAVFRVGISKDRPQQPGSHRGHNITKSSSIPSSIDMQKRVNVILEYEVSVWTRTLFELTEIERKLAFFEFYNPINVTFMNEEYSFAIESDSLSYDQLANPESNEFLDYSLVQSFRIHSYWSEVSQIQAVESILIQHYNTMTETGAIPENLISECVINYN